MTKEAEEKKEQQQPQQPVDVPGLLPSSHWASIPVENEDDDTDSLCSSKASSTTSVRDSILEYRRLYGRTYHHEIGDAESWIPNDDKHLDSMEILHYASILALGNKLFLAPLDKDRIRKVLDVGTGSGLWVIDFADQFPNAQVTGTDITPIQPTWVPPNVSFELDDANQDWTWSSNTFDFIRTRYMIGCISDWKKFYENAFRCLKPGGYFEHEESSGKWYSDTGGIPDESPIAQGLKAFRAAGDKTGRTFQVVEEGLQKKYMEEVGFVDIVVKDVRVPLGTWPEDPEQKQIGMLVSEAILGDLEGYLLYMLVNILGWSEDGARALAAHARAQFRKPGVNPYWIRRVVYGRKPE